MPQTDILENALHRDSMKRVIKGQGPRAEMPSIVVGNDRLPYSIDRVSIEGDCEVNDGGIPSGGDDLIKYDIGEKCRCVTGEAMEYTRIMHVIYYTTHSY